MMTTTKNPSKEVSRSNQWEGLKEPKFIEHLKTWIEHEVDRRVSEEVNRQVKHLVNKGIRDFDRQASQLLEDSIVEEFPKTPQISELSKRSEKMFKFLREYRAAHRMANPEATPSYGEIRGATGLSANQVSDSYKELVAHNIISREQKGRKKIVEFLAP